ncbi:MAG: hypothetical protein EBE86_026155 [Hormoscilla sp. GUM202]|nr:hypothetical protein [Hormoscilla sp. GUM202]
MSTSASHQDTNMYGNRVYVYKSNGKEIARVTGSTREEAKSTADADLPWRSRS